jgi:sugar/nucleoside kinase (ribokinase family)
LDEITTRDVLFIDRPSAGAALAAEHASERGMFVYFEPSARGDERHLARIAACSEVVKYSAERLTEADRGAIAATGPTLEIETRGAEGLRFRSHGTNWREIPAPSVEIKDTAGADGWTTARSAQFCSGKSGVRAR